METIASIPDVSPPTGSSVAGVAAPARERAMRPSFPWKSVLTLATVAAVGWGLATWHEQHRLARQRRPARLASEPPSATGSITP